MRIVADNPKVQVPAPARVYLYEMGVFPVFAEDTREPRLVGHVMEPTRRYVDLRIGPAKAA
jgi:hypothetical protein